MGYEPSNALKGAAGKIDHAGDWTSHSADKAFAQTLEKTLHALLSSSQYRLRDDARHTTNNTLANRCKKCARF